MKIKHKIPIERTMVLSNELWTFRGRCLYIDCTDWLFLITDIDCIDLFKYLSPTEEPLFKLLHVVLAHAENKHVKTHVAPGRFLLVDNRTHGRCWLVQVLDLPK